MLNKPEEEEEEKEEPVVEVQPEVIEDDLIKTPGVLFHLGQCNIYFNIFSAMLVLVTLVFVGTINSK